MGIRYFFLFISITALAKPVSLRWTAADDPNPSLSHILSVVKQRTGLQLDTSDFLLMEDRNLATSHFTMFSEAALGIPLHSLSVRIWTDSQGRTIQVEAILDQIPTFRNALQNTLTSQSTMELVRAFVKQQDDKQIRDLQWKDELENEKLVRQVVVKGKHGKSFITIDIESKKVISYRYSEFPQLDAVSEFSLPVEIYPIYEESEVNRLQKRLASELRYLSAQIRSSETDPYEELRGSHYPDDKMDPLLGLTAQGRKQGFWSMTYIKNRAAEIRERLSLVSNTVLSENGTRLDGRYATVNLFPSVKENFKNLDFQPTLSIQLKPEWKATSPDGSTMEMVPSTALFGRPLHSREDALNRPARRLPNHDPASYLNDGFDELQVYWAVTQLFESLRPMGFVDPELSTRRFNAFLYDPDIEYRDNAYYTDDTINFTTYSPTQQNMARDNTTIWHELGHGVMDRLMGDSIQLADTGGLSEGMADFVAQLVLNDVTGGKPFEGKEHLRIFNQTGFYLTNEVHDDGEAYGGSMNDLLIAAMTKYGRPGLTKVTDLTLETMRLTRNHPGLTAVDWFQHMLFADSLGASVRRPGELRDLIVKALAGRNFHLDTAPVAQFALKNGNDEILAGAPGSRQNPIRVKMAQSEAKSYHMSVQLKSSTSYSFKYPISIKVVFQGGPLQGAIHWTGKEQSPVIYTLTKESDAAQFDLTASGKCDAVNRPDGSCVDYAYVQVWNNGEAKKPVAKKRFYLRISN